jgi:NTP pyrophosphatase (non-canonical NTP hydrolase)
MVAQARNSFEVTVMDSKELEDLEKWSLPGMQEAIHAWAIRKEWRGPNAETQRTTGDDIALIVSEAVEALEAFREKGEPTAIWWTFDVEVETPNGPVKFKHCSKEQLAVIFNCDDEHEVNDLIKDLGLTMKPQGVGPELADVVVRILDYCAEHDINFLNMMQMVMHHNETREIRHGGKHL